MKSMRRSNQLEMVVLVSVRQVGPDAKHGMREHTLRALDDRDRAGFDFVRLAPAASG